MVNQMHLASGSPQAGDKEIALSHLLPLITLQSAKYTEEWSSIWMPPKKLFWSLGLFAKIPHLALAHKPSVKACLLGTGFKNVIDSLPCFQHTPAIGFPELWDSCLALDKDSSLKNVQKVALRNTGKDFLWRILLPAKKTKCWNKRAYVAFCIA